MKRLNGSIVLAAAVLCLAAAPVGAGTEDQVQLQMSVEKEVTVADEKGEKKLLRIPAELVIPGEEVIYTISYQNVGLDPAENVVITNPIPEHVIYTPQSAEGINTDVLFSVNGTDFAEPGQLTIETPDGEPRRPAATEYTHIRWLLNEPLQSGLAGEVAYRARLK